MQPPSFDVEGLVHRAESQVQGRDFRPLLLLLPLLFVY